MAAVLTAAPAPQLIPVADTTDTEWPVLICLLGSFRLLKQGHLVRTRACGKTEALLSTLSLQPASALQRETLLERLWPDSDAALAAQSLNSLIYSLHQLLGGALSGASPVVYQNGGYQLNAAAGVSVDIVCFDALVRTGQQRAQSGDRRGAAAAYARAVLFYR